MKLIHLNRTFLILIAAFVLQACNGTPNEARLESTANIDSDNLLSGSTIISQAVSGGGVFEIPTDQVISEPIPNTGSAIPQDPVVVAVPVVADAPTPVDTAVPVVVVAPAPVDMAPIPVDTTVPVVVAPAPVDMAPIPVDTTVPVVVAPTPVDTTVPVVVAPTPVDTSIPVVVAPTPVVVAPTPVDTSIPVVVAPTPVDTSVPVVVAPTPVVVAPTPVDTSIPVIVAPTPVVVAPTPVDTSIPVIVAPTPVVVAPDVGGDVCVAESDDDDAADYKKKSDHTSGKHKNKKHHGDDNDDKDSNSKKMCKDDEDTSKYCDSKYIAKHHKKGAHGYAFKFVTSTDLKFENTRGKLIIVGTSQHSFVRLVDGHRGKLIFCGVQVQDVKNTRGNIRLYKTEISDLTAHRGHLELDRYSRVLRINESKVSVHKK